MVLKWLGISILLAVGVMLAMNEVHIQRQAEEIRTLRHQLVTSTARERECRDKLYTSRPTIPANLRIDEE